MPTTRNEMRRARYEFIVARPCKGSTCGRPIEIWKTTNGAILAFDGDIASDDAEMTSHAVTCCAREELREQARRNPPQRRAAAPVFDSPGATGVRNAPGVPLLGTAEVERELASMRQRSGAIAAVLIYETASICAWKVPLEPEDARNSIIAAANHTRDAIRAKREEKAGA